MYSISKLNLNEFSPTNIDNLFDRSIFQSLPWLIYLEQNKSATIILAEIKEDNNTVGYLTGLIVNLFGFRIFGSPFRGWLTNSMGFNIISGCQRQEILKVLPEFVFNKLNCHYLEIIDPEITKKDFELLPYIVEEINQFLIDLTTDENNLLSHMDAKSCRWSIRKAEKSGVTIEEAKIDGFVDDHYAQLIDVFSKQKLIPPNKKSQFVSLINTVFSSSNLLLLQARNSDGLCIASGIFPGFNETAFYLSGASLSSFQYLRPNELMIWYAIKYWKNRGIKSFNMGSGWPEFKIKFGSKKINIYRLSLAKYKFLSFWGYIALNLFLSIRKILFIFNNKTN